MWGSSMLLCSGLAMLASLLLSSIFVPSWWPLLVPAGLPAAPEDLDPDAPPRPPHVSYNDDFFKEYLTIETPPGRDFPLFLRPVPGAFASFSVEGCEGRLESDSPKTISCFVQEHREWLRSKFYQHGALFFRGFRIDQAADFEGLAVELVHPNLPFDRVYLGTSPRTSAVDNTKYVHTAADIPGWQYINPHAEMSFKPNPPTEILFYCSVPVEGEGGQSPLTDFRQVWREMNPDTRRRFEEGKIRYVRKYYSKAAGGVDSVYPLTRHPSFQKDWESMFQTEDREEAERMARQQGFEPSWLHEHMLSLGNTLNATRVHPATGEEVWHNHLAMLHTDSWHQGYGFATHHFESTAWRWQNALIHHGLKLLSWAATKWYGEEGPLGTHVTFKDGSEIPTEDMAHVFHLLWRHTVLEKWQYGDVVFLDNYRIAHGRMPFAGPRRTLVTWVE